MIEVFIIDRLPHIDREQVLRGLCPWCVERLVDRTLYGEHGDECPECGDIFTDQP